MIGCVSQVCWLLGHELIYALFFWGKKMQKFQTKAALGSPLFFVGRHSHHVLQRPPSSVRSTGSVPTTAGRLPTAAGCLPAAGCLSAAERLPTTKRLPTTGEIDLALEQLWAG
jgi:hypothetical protein